MKGLVMEITSAQTVTTSTASRETAKDTGTADYLKLKNKYMYERNDKEGNVPGLSNGEFSSLFELAEKMKYSKDPQIAAFGRQQSDELLGIANFEKSTKYAAEDNTRLLKNAQQQSHKTTEIVEKRQNAGFLARLFGKAPSDEDIAKAYKAESNANKEVSLHRDQMISPRTIEAYYLRDIEPATPRYK